MKISLIKIDFLDKVIVMLILDQKSKKQTKITQYFPGKYQKMCQLRIQNQNQEKCIVSNTNRQKLIMTQIMKRLKMKYGKKIVIKILGK